ncbi:hypothetical protein HT031_004322 [Scenedesmus sp. PABB004]|nr:hypothetical protein HT031_004322 [Scenedesmus sp. PABB004]
MAPSAAAVRGGDGDGGCFVTFLPGDNQDLASASTQATVELMSADLSQLLRLPPAAFWHVVLADASLHACLDSFLRFRRRCYDDDGDAQGAVQGSSDVLLQLSQRVFKVFWRMAHPQELTDAAPRQPPAAGGRGGGRGGRGGGGRAGAAPAGALQPGDAAAALYDRWLVDVPKLMDLAVLYGPGNPELTRQLLQQVLRLQPRYAQDVVRLAEPLSGNLHELALSVKRLANRALAGASAGDGAGAPLLAELSESVRYFTDAFLTLQALADCLPEAAALLLAPVHHGALLLALAVVHGGVLPLLARVAAQPQAAAHPALAPGRVRRLQVALERLVFCLLRAACGRGGRGRRGAPRRARPAAAPADGGGFSAELQGQELMNLLMLLAHPSDHTAAGGDGGGGGAPHQQAGLLTALNHAHHLDVAVAGAAELGLLSLDDAQFDYMLALLDGDRELLQRRQQQQVQQQQQQQPQPGGAAGAVAAAAAGAAQTAPPPLGELAAQLAAIRELLPDFGDGYLTAALFHCGWSTEAAINCLLEGALPAGLRGLEPGLKSWTPPAAGAGGDGGQAGALSWTGLAREAASAAPPRGAADVPLPSAAAAAAAAAGGGPRPAVDRRTGRVLGALPAALRSATKSIAAEMQFEYDDEYDDSFDDLVGPGADGVCDIEVEDSGAAAAARGGGAGPSGGGAGGAGPGGAGPSGGAGAGARGGRRPAADRLWVADGKVYNYKRAGAQEVAGQAGAAAALAAARAAAAQIHGLGPGGNVPPPAAPPPGQGRGGGGGGAAAPGPPPGDGGGGGRGRGGAPGRGGGGGEPGGAPPGEDGGGGGRGRGRGRGGYAHKEAHKGAIGNHHRKDRATAKAARGMF